MQFAAALSVLADFLLKLVTFLHGGHLFLNPMYQFKKTGEKNTVKLLDPSG